MNIKIHDRVDYGNTLPSKIDELRKQVKQAVEVIQEMCPKEWSIISAYLRTQTVPRGQAKDREEAADLYNEHSAFVKLCADLQVF